MVNKAFSSSCQEKTNMSFNKHTIPSDSTDCLEKQTFSSKDFNTYIPFKNNKSIIKSYILPSEIINPLQNHEFAFKKTTFSLGEK